MEEKTISTIEKCPLCQSDITEYDDYVEYGDGQGNDGSYYVKMCSNENCPNFQGMN